MERAQHRRDSSFGGCYGLIMKWPSPAHVFGYSVPSYCFESLRQEEAWLSDVSDCWEQFGRALSILSILLPGTM